MEFINEILWMSLMPIVIYIGYKVVTRNVLKFEQKEN